jgi:hypothetical protein
MLLPAFFHPYRFVIGTGANQRGGIDVLDSYLRVRLMLLKSDEYHNAAFTVTLKRRLLLAFGNPRPSCTGFTFSCAWIHFI